MHMNSLLKGRTFLPIVLFSLLLLPFVMLINKFSPPVELAPIGYNSSILAFEFVRNTDELKEVLTPLSPEQLTSLDRVNYVDFGFMIAYSLILFLFARRLALEFSSVIIKIALFLPLFILLSDLAENLQLLHLSQLFVEGSEEYYDIHIAQLKLYTWMKWGSLAIYFLLTGWHILRTRATHYWIGAMMLVPFVGLIASAFFQERKVWGAFAESIFFMFLLILIYSLLYKRKVNAEV